MAGDLRVRQHAPDFRRIRIRCNHALAQFSLSPGGFLGQDVPGEGVMSFNLAGARDFEALGCAFMCF
jgi:hypothetical protein